LSILFWVPVEKGIMRNPSFSQMSQAAIAGPA
jgi:hypothetical protein